MKIKISVAVALFIFFAATVSIVTAGLVSREIKKNNLISQNNSLNNTGNQNSQLDLSSEEIAKHNQAGDCWIIVENKVYNVTGFLAGHPGGADLIIPYCGKDASDAFRTKDRNSSSGHSQFANELLGNYYLGMFGENINTGRVAETLGSPTTTPANKPPNSGSLSDSTSPNTQTLGTSSVALTTTEVSSHNTAQNCWIIVSGNVYNVTGYIARHPGGFQAIANVCGADATTAFQTQGGQGSHSQTAYNLLSGYLIGSLGSTTSISVNSPISSNTNPGTSGTSGTQTVSAKYPGAVVQKQEIEDDGRQELKIIYNGQCIKIKTDLSGQIISEEGC